MSHVAFSWGVVLAFIGGVLLTQVPVLNPDALEMGLVGKSLWGTGATGLDSFYYPPAFPLLSALAAAALPLHAGILVIAPLAFCAVVFALWRLLDARNQWLTAAVLLGVLWSSAELRALAVSPDPRGLQLAFFFGGTALLLGPAQRIRCMVVGLLAGLLVLTRPEGFLFSSLLLAAAVFHWRQKAIAAWACFFAVVLPYVWLVSRAVGNLSLNSRAWEIKGSGLLEFLPVRPLVHLWGAGAQGTPFREVLRELGPQTAVPQENLLGSLGAAAGELGASLLPLWWVAAAWGGVLIWRSRRLLMLLLGGAVAVSMALYLVPMGRDLALLLINLLPAVVALHFLAVWGLVDALQRLERRIRGGMITIGLAVFLVGAFGLTSGTGHALPESYSSAASWMKVNLPPSTRVASSLGSSPIVHQAERVWEHIPSRW